MADLAVRMTLRLGVLGQTAQTLQVLEGEPSAYTPRENLGELKVEIAYDLKQGERRMDR